MPFHLKASIRYQVIDRCLRDHSRSWFWSELADAVAEELAKLDEPSRKPGRRTIMSDLADMRSGKLGYQAPITFSKTDGYRYDDTRFSIHQNRIPPALMQNLQEGFQWINQLAKNEKLEEIAGAISRVALYLNMDFDPGRAPLVYFEHSLNEPGQAWLDKIYHHVKNKTTLWITYQAFGKEESKHFFSPGFIKEYNNRWYVFGYDHELGKIINLGLDRIISVQPSLRPYTLPEYWNYDVHFENLYGVTIPENAQPVEIKFQTTKPLSRYMDTKPIHPTQKKISNHEDHVLYSVLVYDNYEIRSKLLSFGQDVKVTQPAGFFDPKINPGKLLPYKA